MTEKKQNLNKYRANTKIYANQRNSEKRNKKKRMRSKKMKECTLKKKREKVQLNTHYNSEERNKREKKK